MLTLRLSKFKSSQKGYDVVVCNKQSGLGKKFVDKVGYLVLGANKRERYLVIDKKKLAIWILRGVKVSHKLRLLLVKS